MHSPLLSDGMSCCEPSLPEVIMGDGSLLDPFCLSSLPHLPLCDSLPASQPQQGMAAPNLNYYLLGRARDGWEMWLFTRKLSFTSKVWYLF